VIAFIGFFVVVLLGIVLLLLSLFLLFCAASGFGAEGEAISSARFALMAFVVLYLAYHLSPYSIVVNQ
jgi:hypothetical protein